MFPCKAEDLFIEHIAQFNFQGTRGIKKASNITISDGTLLACQKTALLSL